MDTKNIRTSSKQIIKTPSNRDTQKTSTTTIPMPTVEGPFNPGATTNVGHPSTTPEHIPTKNLSNSGSNASIQLLSLNSNSSNTPRYHSAEALAGATSTDGTPGKSGSSKTNLKDRKTDRKEGDSTGPSTDRSKRHTKGPSTDSKKSRKTDQQNVPPLNLGGTTQTKGKNASSKSKKATETKKSLVNTITNLGKPGQTGNSPRKQEALRETFAKLGQKLDITNPNSNPLHQLIFFTVAELVLDAAQPEDFINKSLKEICAPAKYTPPKTVSPIQPMDEGDIDTFCIDRDFEINRDFVPGEEKKADGAAPAQLENHNATILAIMAALEKGYGVDGDLQVLTQSATPSTPMANRETPQQRDQQICAAWTSVLNYIDSRLAFPVGAYRLRKVQELYAHCFLGFHSGEKPDGVKYGEIYTSLCNIFHYAENEKNRLTKNSEQFKKLDNKFEWGTLRHVNSFFIFCREIDKQHGRITGKPDGTASSNRDFWALHAYGRICVDLRMNLPVGGQQAMRAGKLAALLAEAYCAETGLLVVNREFPTEIRKKIEDNFFLPSIETVKDLINAIQNPKEKELSPIENNTPSDTIEKNVDYFTNILEQKYEYFKPEDLVFATLSFIIYTKLDTPAQLEITREVLKKAVELCGAATPMPKGRDIKRMNDALDRVFAQLRKVYADDLKGSLTLRTGIKLGDVTDDSVKPDRGLDLAAQGLVAAVNGVTLNDWVPWSSSLMTAGVNVLAYSPRVAIALGAVAAHTLAPLPARIAAQALAMVTVSASAIYMDYQIRARKNAYEQSMRRTTADYTLRPTAMWSLQNRTVPFMMFFFALGTLAASSYAIMSAFESQELQAQRAEQQQQLEAWLPLYNSTNSTEPEPFPAPEAGNDSLTPAPAINGNLTNTTWLPAGNNSAPMPAMMGNETNTTALRQPDGAMSSRGTTMRADTLTRSVTEMPEPQPFASPDDVEENLLDLSLSTPEEVAGTIHRLESEIQRLEAAIKEAEWAYSVATAAPRILMELQLTRLVRVLLLSYVFPPADTTAVRNIDGTPVPAAIDRRIERGRTIGWTFSTMMLNAVLPTLANAYLPDSAYKAVTQAGLTALLASFNEGINFCLIEGSKSTAWLTGGGTRISLAKGTRLTGEKRRKDFHNQLTSRFASNSHAVGADVVTAFNATLGELMRAYATNDMRMLAMGLVASLGAVAHAVPNSSRTTHMAFNRDLPNMMEEFFVPLDKMPDNLAESFARLLICCNTVGEGNDFKQWVRLRPGMIGSNDAMGEVGVRLATYSVKNFMEKKETEQDRNIVSLGTPLTPHSQRSGGHQGPRSSPSTPTKLPRDQRGQTTVTNIPPSVNSSASGSATPPASPTRPRQAPASPPVYISDDDELVISERSGSIST